MNYKSIYHPQIYRLLLCIGWVLSTTIALRQSAAISQINYRAWHDSSSFLMLAALLLALWELPLIWVYVYQITKSWQTSLIRSFWWGASFLLVIPLALPIAFMVLMITPFGFVIIELLIGLLQWPVIKPFSSHSIRWPLIRILAFSIATLIGSQTDQAISSDQAVFSITSSLGLPSARNALVMGVIGGLIKGIGFVYLLRWNPQKIGS